LPPEEKTKLYSDDPARKIRLSTSFNVSKETVHNWRDYLRLHCHPADEFVPDPLDEFVPDFFNSSKIKDTMRRYFRGVFYLSAIKKICSPQAFVRVLWRCWSKVLYWVLLLCLFHMLYSTWYMFFMCLDFSFTCWYCSSLLFRLSPSLSAAIS
jgi:hypothetical protein